MTPTTNTLGSSIEQDSVLIKEAFEKSYHRIVNDLLTDLEQENAMPKEGLNHIQRLLEHNVCGGKLNRGIAVVETLMILAKSHQRELSEHEIFLAHVAGWAIEWLQACFLVADDLMDQSVTRRGKPCWFRMENVGYTAVNDAFLLESQIYRLFKKHFRSLPGYLNLLELFHDVTYITECGQLMDMLTSDQPTSSFHSLRHAYIVQHKTSYYSFYLPVGVALILFGFTDVQLHHQAKSILLPLGDYFQIQDDYLDCFGDPKIMGKVGTDIQEKKCTWLITQALHLTSSFTPTSSSSPSSSSSSSSLPTSVPVPMSSLPTPTLSEHQKTEMRSFLLEFYGSKDHVDQIKHVYKELKLPERYQVYEEQSYQYLHHLIQSLNESLGVPKSVYEGMVAKIYRRSK